MPAPDEFMSADAYRVRVRIPIFDNRSALLDLREALAPATGVVREWTVHAHRTHGIEAIAYVPIDRLRGRGSFAVIAECAEAINEELRSFEFVYGVRGAPTSVVGTAWVRWPEEA